MRETVINHIEQRFQAWRDLAEAVDDDQLMDKLPVAKSKALREHFWCVIGARESYTKALEAGEWVGFGCSLEKIDREEVLSVLDASATNFRKTVNAIDDWNDQRHELLTMLMEHEVMHEGQVIRLMYGLERDLPESWVWA